MIIVRWMLIKIIFTRMEETIQMPDAQMRVMGFRVNVDIAAIDHRETDCPID